MPKVFLHDNCEQISFIIFFAFLKKEEMRSGTHFTQLNVFLLLTVVVTKHVWPYFQSRFPKTSSERVSSSIQVQNRLLNPNINNPIIDPAAAATPSRQQPPPCPPLIAPIQMRRNEIPTDHVIWREQ